jgi:hypothetical protein
MGLAEISLRAFFTIACAPALAPAKEPDLLYTWVASSGLNSN